MSLRWVLGLVVALAALAVFLWVLARVLLTPVPGAEGEAAGNLEPGASLRFYLDRPGVRAALLQVGGNLVLMAPLGVILPLVAERLRGPLRVGLVAGLLSLAAEVAQGVLVLGRAFDADDVILNTAGAVLAYFLIGRRLSRWFHARRRRPAR
ncbi:VanZ family protein [Bailinhaonella thermotolerans]|uniref:VanZ family protein n=1 Tax=Bailinhaonella thermotolerans TaxID=1070861 RepID=A0A3A4B0I4_9ACTN|nr:VanZ family protein [Bailinhaonella thermotolerans]